MIKAVVFDLDHTLFDRHGTLRCLVPMLRNEFRVNEKMTDDEIGSIWCYADDHFVYHGWEYILRYLKENAVFISAPSFEEYERFIYKYFECTAVPFPETIPMLELLRENGYKTGLITNGYHKLQYSKINMLSLSGHFDEIIVSGDYELFKPDTAIFEIMQGKLGCSPGEIVYVGDNPVNDVEGARNSGWKTIWIRSTGYWDENIKRADREVDTVSQIVSAVKSLEE